MQLSPRSSYTNMGVRPDVILPAACIMRDRNDDKEWLLSWGNGAYDGPQPLHFTPKMRFALSDNIPNNLRKDLLHYDALYGPFLADRSRNAFFRLLIRGTRLGFEPVTNVGDPVVSASEGRLFGKSGYTPIVLEVKLPSIQRPIYTLAWEEFDLHG